MSNPIMRVHPLTYRDLLVIEGYSTEKANEYVIDLYRKQGMSEKDLKEVRRILETR